MANVTPPNETKTPELPAKWRAQADAHELNGLHACSVGLKQTADELDARAKAIRTCADELESLLGRGGK